MLVRHGLRLLVAGLLLTGLTIGCEDNNQSFIILGNVVGVPQQAGPCTYAVDSTLVLRAGGTVDVSVRNNYIASLAVENQLILRRDELNARAETSYGVFRDAEVRMTDGAGNAVTSFTTPVTQNDVPPGARRGIVFTPMVDPNLMNKLATELKFGEARDYISYVKLNGRTSGNKTIATDEFQYLIRVCRGCLVSFPAASRDPSIAKPNCKSTEAPEGDPPCSFGIDDRLDCRYCQGSAACDPCTTSSDPACKNP